MSFKNLKPKDFKNYSSYCLLLIQSLLPCCFDFIHSVICHCSHLLGNVQEWLILYSLQLTTFTYQPLLDQSWSISFKQQFFGRIREFISKPRARLKFWIAFDAFELFSRRRGPAVRLEIDQPIAGKIVLAAGFTLLSIFNC